LEGTLFDNYTIKNNFDRQYSRIKLKKIHFYVNSQINLLKTWKSSI